MDRVIIAIFLALALGAFIGLQFRKNAEEDHYHNRAFAGMRTCMAITLLGFLSVYLTEFFPQTFVLLSSFFLLLILISYVQQSFQEKRIGATSELTLVMVYVVGILAGLDQMNLAIVLTIILSIIATGQDYLYGFSDKFSKVELIETTKFAIIIFLVLPFLPNETIDPLGVINPYRIWFLVILISGLSFLGYMSSKFVGKSRGVLLSGFLGGLVSSTAVTTSMALENKRRPKYLFVYASAILLASLMMYLRVLVEVAIINPQLISKLVIPLGAMFFTMLGFALYFYKYKSWKKTPKLKSRLQLSSPFSLGPAIKFSIFFVVILLLIKISELTLGDKGVYLTAIISSLADIDAISISLSKLSGTGVISEQLAIRAITYATISNTLIKIVYLHFFGNRELTRTMLGIYVCTGLVGIATTFLI